jgi:hypothetical protein
LHGPGQPLDSASRAFFEPRFGHDFSRVRVHTDARAAESARAVDALAYAVGQHIVFGTGQYRPRTTEGRKLLAHELVHTLQQRGSGDAPTTELEVTPAADPTEREAEAAVEAITNARRFTPVLRQPVRVARQGGDGGSPTCGPNVTSRVRDAIRIMRAVFEDFWTNDERNDACEALVKAETRKQAWDIRELHSQQWVERYRPECATYVPGATPCGLFPTDPDNKDGAVQASVQIDSGCHYMGSVNYVIFGHMCKLCHDFYWSLQSGLQNLLPWHWGMKVADPMIFTEDGMELMVQVYKGPIELAYPDPSGLSAYVGGAGHAGLRIWQLQAAQANYEGSRKWSAAGYSGWGLFGSSAATPAGDRPGCAPTCPHAYPALHKLQPGEQAGDMGTGPFHVLWAPKGIIT